VKKEVEEMLQQLESIRFIDFSPELMRSPSIPGQVVLSDRGDNLSSVLQAICETPESKRALSNWIQELTPMDVVDFEFVPDAAGKILVYLVEEGGRKTSANSASDGTLRFLGMLAALLGPKPARFYFLEEIDNGIHPARLALLMDLLDNQSRSKGIQVVATTHSPQVLRLIKEENLKYATLAYRLKGSAEGRLKPLSEIPHLQEVIQRKDIARLHESSWMENTMEFSEGNAKAFPIEAKEGKR
jgi:predicted ATPase